MAMFILAVAAAVVPAPIALAETERLTVLAVSADARSDTAKRLTIPLPQAVRFVFHCEMNMRRGDPTRCIEAGGDYPKNWDEYRLRANALSAKLREVDADPLLRVAHSRIMQIRVVDAARRATEETTIMTFAETIASGDALPEPAPAEMIEPKDFTLVQQAMAVKLADLYPSYAMRNEVRARTTLVCRINADLTLNCRNAVAEPTLYPDNPDYERVSGEFRLAAYQMMSIMKVSSKARDNGALIGKDFEYPVFWDIPR